MTRSYNSRRGISKIKKFREFSKCGEYHCIICGWKKPRKTKPIYEILKFELY